jgi:hypothetical protein
MRRMVSGGLLLCAVLGCTDTQEELPPAERSPPATAADDGAPVAGDPPRLEAELGPGTPAGGYVDWTTELRGVLARVVNEAQQDREAALRMVQDAYAARHEYLERYFGPGGLMFASDELAQAVDRSASHFHELIRQLASMEEEPGRIEETVRAAQQALYDVEAHGQAAGLPPDAPRDR